LHCPPCSLQSVISPPLPGRPLLRNPSLLLLRRRTPLLVLVLVELLLLL
jgi:hypothetical protein